MNEAWPLTFATIAGALLAGFFFGGLWWTIRRGVLSKHPAPWFIGSYLIRTGTVLTGFYLVFGGSAPRLAACLFGFIAARFAMTRGAAWQLRRLDSRETGHAA